ncbi:proline-rich membrane anchor 1 [Marmota marmota marmota]|uniref:proline-rich membrane anchor 1 n=1 Tax=Marmota marmota marmota TaxID=9994 RepID=UPI00076234CC|nr:proline-rich membrane anchor 1 [Marmota marmota marmota]
MLLRDLVLRRGCCWPSLLLHCALHPLWGFVQVTHGEPQKSCSKVTDTCQHICQCRPPPPLPPPPPRLPGSSRPQFPTLPRAPMRRAGGRGW